MKSKPDVLFEDDHLLIVNKPAGWLTIPDRYNPSKPCVSSFFKEKEVLIVHRIDKDTSGVLLMAKTALAHQRLNTQFENRTIEKIYVALLCGDLRSQTTVDQPLIPEGNGRVKTSPKGKSAHSIFYPELRFGKWTWTRVIIKTGRTHQIRVHAAHIGYAVAADPLYGDGLPIHIADIKPKARSLSDRPLIRRTALHASQLGFKHPYKEERMTIEAPLPKDLNACLNQLSKWRKTIDIE